MWVSKSCGCKHFFVLLYYTFWRNFPPPEIGGEKELVLLWYPPLSPTHMKYFVVPLCQSVYHCGNPNKVCEDHRDRRYISTYHHLFDFAKHLMDKNVSDYLDMTNYEIIITKNSWENNVYVLSYNSMSHFYKQDKYYLLLYKMQHLPFDIWVRIFWRIIANIIIRQTSAFLLEKIVEYGFRNNLVVLEITFLDVIFL